MRTSWRTFPAAVLVLGCTSFQSPRSISARATPATSSLQTVGSPSLQPLDSWHDVGTATLHLRCHGSGSPLVVFESGLGQSSSAWVRVQSEVARATRTCSYDRAGHGSSSKAAFPRDQHTMAKELHRLLTHAKEPGPYVLVGHSLGAAIARWFLADHPSDVAGLILLDPTTEEWGKRVLPLVPPQDLPGFWRSVRAWEGMDEQSCIAGYEGLALQARALGTRPLVILTAERLQRDYAMRVQMHAHVLRLSDNNAHVRVPDSSHDITHDSPSSVVAAVSATLKSIEDDSVVANHLPPSLPAARRY